jgi:poly-beta-1,6-N-acetyl-D-glucosamine synthase
MTLRYVLITPARNEAAYIEKTIQSVIAQTVLPERWVIVSDGSTDGTDAIVQSYLDGRPWLELLSLPERHQRDFAGKVGAFAAGFARVRDLAFDIVGNVDADISFGPDYFEFLLQKFEEMPELGVAGSHYVEGEFHSFRDSFIDARHVNGACQLFRRACYESIGGYVPNKGGGIDWVAVTTARMKGWETRSFSERVFHHHRPIGTEGAGVLKARFHYGKKDYFTGGHPLWQLFRGTFQMSKEPYVIGGMLLLAGYFWAWMTGYPRAVSEELMRFHREEQMRRLKRLLGERLHLQRT